MKRILSVLFISFTTQLPALSNGVSMTNNPVSNSSGGVNVTAVQNVPSRQFTNTFSKNSFQCQGDTFVIQPFVTTNASFTRPFDSYRMDPIFDERDNFGLITIDDDGNEVDGPDGAPDNPGAVLGWKKVATNQKENYSINPGISLSWNINLDRQSVRRCREGAEQMVKLLTLDAQDKRLAMEMGRLSKCGDLLSKGIRFKAGTKYESLCSDVEIVNFIPVNKLPNHTHSIPTSLETSKAN
mgnify:FL=1